MCFTFAQNMRRNLRVAFVIVAIVAGAVVWFAFGTRAEPPDIDDVEATLRSIGSGPHLQLVTLSSIAPRPPGWRSRLTSGVKAMLTNESSIKGATGIPSGGVQYEFQTSSGLIVCRVYYKDYTVQQIELVAAAISLSDIEEIRDLLKNAHRNLRVEVIEHP